MAIIFFALAAVMILVVVFLSIIWRNKERRNNSWENPSMR